MKGVPDRDNAMPLMVQRHHGPALTIPAGALRLLALLIGNGAEDLWWDLIGEENANRTLPDGIPVALVVLLPVPARARVVSADLPHCLVSMLDLLPAS